METPPPKGPRLSPDSDAGTDASPRPRKKHNPSPNLSPSNNLSPSTHPKTPAHHWLLRATRKLLETLIVASLGAYGGACGVMYGVQNRLIFFPSAAVTQTPEILGVDYEDAWIPVPTLGPGNRPRTEKLHAWWIPAPKPDRPVILLFHGNGANIGASLGQAQKFAGLGYGILMVEYRGYGRSEGSFPSEKSVYTDAEAAWTYLTQTRQIAPQQIVIFGHSLGGAIAIDLATRHPEAAALIVQSSFTSMAHMIRRIDYSQYFPIEQLLIHRFDSLSKVPHLRLPVLYLHGTADELVPPSMSRALYEATPQDPSNHRDLLIIEGAFHTNVQDIGGPHYLDKIQTFIQQAQDQTP